MKTEDQYLRFVRWNEEDKIYVGYCPDLFPWGGVCHWRKRRVCIYHQLCILVREEVEQLSQDGKDLPIPGTRPMREAVLA